MGAKTLAAAVVVAAVSVVGGTAALKSPSPACSYRGLLPDPICTPGAVNPSVTQATIRRTICVSGWTATIRPSVSVTGPMKRRSMSAYGVGAQSPSGFEYDHLISLELGGAPASTLNLWPEPHPGSFAKDLIENALKRAVCAGRMTLAAAQHRIATDWTKGATP